MTPLIGNILATLDKLKPPISLRNMVNIVQFSMTNSVYPLPGLSLLLQKVLDHYTLGKYQSGY